MMKFNKIKSLVLFFGVFFYHISLYGQITTTITTGTAGTPQYNAGPIYRSSASSAYDASRYAYLYTQAELAAAGINPGDFINSLGWTKNNNAVTNGGGIFRIYMKNSSATTFANATETWANLNAGTTLVYENLNQSIPATTTPNYIVFDLIAPFAYTGGSLEISTEWDINQVSGNPSTGTFDWLWSTVPNAIYGTGNTVLTSTGTLSSTTNSISTIDDRRPFIQIVYTPGSPCTAPPTAGTAIASAASVCPSTAFTVSLNGNTFGLGQTYQWESSTDNVNFTPIAGATNASYSNTQSQSTYYRAVLTCSGQSATSTSVLINTTPFVNCYCASNATSNANTDIFSVGIGTMTNTSTCSTTGGPGSIQGQYSDYTSNVTAPILMRTNTYSFNVEVGTCGTSAGNVTKIYIDFNQNGSFTDPGEEIYAPTASSTGANTVTGTVTIPLSAVIGQTRMRVVTNQTTVVGNVNPCGTYTSGETEDYLVEIAPVPTCPQPTDFTVLSTSTSGAELTWTPGGTETTWDIYYGPAGFDPTTSGTLVTSTTNPTIDPTELTGLPSNTFFDVFLVAQCSSTDSSSFVGPISFNTYGIGQYMEADAACGQGFINVSTTGTLLSLNDDDESPIIFPFPVYYQGTIITEATLGNNGGLVLGTTTAQLALTNTALATAANGLYPFWEDLATTGPGIWVDTVGVAPNRIFVIQWEKDRFGEPGNPLLFQLQIHESNMEIYFVYEDVITGDVLYDFGASATVGVAGPNQDIQLSFNNVDYLTNNSCAHFYYTDCPKPTNLTFSNIGFDVADVDWSTGLSNEVEWTLEYGNAGFTPGTGTILTDILVSNQTLPNLTQLTEYDVYVYAQCANGDSSFALVGSFLTAPICANPTAVTATADIDSIFVTWNWAQTQEPISHFNIQYHPQSNPMYSGVEYQGTAANFADTIIDANLMAGVTYSVYVQAECSQGDTSSYVGPFNITMPLTNDSVCFAEVLLTDGTVYNFVGTSATVDNTATPTESSIAPPITGLQTTTGWSNATITKSTWFTFEAPATGQVRISGKDVGFDGQIAVYEVGDCDDFSTFELLAANDDEIGGSSLAPNFTVCGLTPGATYYLMHDPKSTSTTLAFNYSIKITSIDLEAGNSEPLLNICTGDTIDLYSTINGNDLGGIWIPTNSNVALVQDSLFSSNGLAYQTFNFQYRVTDGCAYDSIISQVKIFAPSTAGEDGGFTVCRNEHFDLLQGLGGLIQAGGTWYDPSNNPLPNSQVIASNFPGQYNYDYIVGNGVCPDDTALVIVNVNGACDFLGVELLDANSIEIYPNPTDGIIQINNNRNENFSLVVTDLNGRVVYQESNSVLADNQSSIDLSMVESGLYLVKIYNASNQRVERILIK